MKNNRRTEIIIALADNLANVITEKDFLKDILWEIDDDLIDDFFKKIGAFAMIKLMPEILKMAESEVKTQEEEEEFETLKAFFNVKEE